MATASIVLPKLQISSMELTLIGDTPLIVHKWSEKAKKEMLDKQMKKAKGAKEAKDPQKDFNDAYYTHPDGGYGFPIIGFKNAAVTACTSIDGVTKVAARQAFRVGTTLSGSELAKIEGSEPRMREDMVRIAMGTADIRYRPEFWPWWTTILIQYNENVLSAEQIVNLFNTAGFGVGLGDWRMEKNGQNGCYHVASGQEIENIEKFGTPVAEAAE